MESGPERSRPDHRHRNSDSGSSVPTANPTVSDSPTSAPIGAENEPTRRSPRTSNSARPTMNERLPTDQPARDHIRAARDVTMFVEAGAGSGKTRALVDRVEALVLHDRVPLEQIAAITFTERCPLWKMAPPYLALFQLECTRRAKPSAIRVEPPSLETEQDAGAGQPRRKIGAGSRGRPSPLP